MISSINEDYKPTPTKVLQSALLFPEVLPGCARSLNSRKYRSREIIKPIFIRFSFPPRWHYDILRALDYFQAVNATRDQRLNEAINIVRSEQHEDGRWSLQNCYKGKTYFALERLGAPSRWNTLRALRVLKWWDEGKPDAGRRQFGTS